jgi:SagB-type dehydrogenase family enzyme
MVGKTASAAVKEAGELPRPRLSGPWSVEGALAKRRSAREYTGEALTRAKLAQLLWAAQGITDAEGLRTAPSAGALYPLEVYVAVGAVEDLPSGIYRYEPGRHVLAFVAEGDKRAELAAAALGQECVQEGAAVIALAAVYRRTTGKYGERGIRYVHMEVGHAAQNVYLQAIALGLGMVVVGAFDDRDVKRVMNMGAKEEPVCLMPVGRAR